MKRNLFSLCIVSSLLLALLMAQPASAIAGVWNPTGSMGTLRSYHTATLLSNGLVLVAGNGSAERYNPATGTWTATGSMLGNRLRHTATLLPDGRVLVTGGGPATAELYDPATGLWRSAGTMQTISADQTATLLANGKVLVVGWDSAELYDPATNTWSPTGSMNTARRAHAAVQLQSGKVLVMGGYNVVDAAIDSAEIYDPATGAWRTTGSLGTGRRDHTATLLSNGTVLVVGGWFADEFFHGTLSSAELYDPATGIWTFTGFLTTDRVYHTATLLSNGKVLVAGGYRDDDSFGEFLSSAEIYDPVAATWTATSSMGARRHFHTAVLLPFAGGKVLVSGGHNENRVFASAELYTSTQLLQPKSNASKDGWVLETSETSNQGGAIDAMAITFNLGDTANRQQYRSILHFNTASLPDTAIITRAVLRIKKHSLAGTDPFSTHGKIAIDIRRGAFSNVDALQRTDFQAPASKPGAGVIANNPAAGGWYAARLSAAAYPFVNRTGITQFRLRFQLDDDNDRVADFLRFYSGEAPVNYQPVLVVEYYVP